MSDIAAAAQAARAGFQSFHYLRHNMRRQEHLATLGLDLNGRTVLETGAGIGDHTTFFLDRACGILSFEPRPENFYALSEAMKEYFRGVGTNPDAWRGMLGGTELLDNAITETFDIVYCYGTLYHTSDPGGVLKGMAKRCGAMLLLETCVSYGNTEAINPVPEPASSISQSIEGLGCRPTRPWIFNRLHELFPYVYLPKSQPAHEEFPLDWSPATAPNSRLSRAVFIGSRQAINNPLLVDHLPMRQVQC